MYKHCLKFIPTHIYQIILIKTISIEAWRVVPVGPQGNVTFNFPEDTSVGAFYTREDGSRVNIGPYPTTPGTSWTCNTDTQYDDRNMTVESKLKLKNKIISCCILN